MLALTLEKICPLNGIYNKVQFMWYEHFWQVSVCIIVGIVCIQEITSRLATCNNNDNKRGLAGFVLSGQNLLVNTCF